MKFLSRLIFTLKADRKLRQQRLTCLVCSLRPSFLTKTEAFSLFLDFLTASPCSLTFCRNKSTTKRLCCPSSRSQNSSDENCLSSSPNSSHVELVRNSPPAPLLQRKLLAVTWNGTCTLEGPDQVCSFYPSSEKEPLPCSRNEDTGSELNEIAVYPYKFLSLYCPCDLHHEETWLQKFRMKV